MTQPLPHIALSIQQPWAHLIVSGLKDVENRTWVTGHRGPVLVHAGKKIDTDCERMLRAGEHPAYPQAWAHKPPLEFDHTTLPNEWLCGGIVGVADMIDCVHLGSGGSHTKSSWFKGPFGFLLKNARPLPFMPCRGQLGFFACTYFESRAIA